MRGDGARTGVATLVTGDDSATTGLQGLSSDAHDVDGDFDLDLSHPEMSDDLDAALGRDEYTGLIARSPAMKSMPMGSNPVGDIQKARQAKYWSHKVYRSATFLVVRVGDIIDDLFNRVNLQHSKVACSSDLSTV